MYLKDTARAASAAALGRPRNALTVQSRPASLLPRARRACHGPRPLPPQLLRAYLSARQRYIAAVLEAAAGGGPDQDLETLTVILGDVLVLVYRVVAQVGAFFFFFVTPCHGDRWRCEWVEEKVGACGLFFASTVVLLYLPMGAPRRPASFFSHTPSHGTPRRPVDGPRRTN